MTRIGRALQALPVPPGDAGAARARLLAAAERLPTRRRSRVIVGATALAAAAAAIVAIVASRDTSTTRIIVEATGATWSRHDGSDATLIRLEDGALDLAVAHGAQARRLVVSVPDGEIDDIGTAFRIEVAHGQLRTVQVRDGAVVVRLLGGAPVFLVAGEHWDRPAAPPPPPVAPAPIAPAPIAPAPVAPHPSPRASSPASELAAAVRLLDANDLAGATAALRAFIAHHATDPRAEDASYLLVIALDRRGDRTGAAVAARAYLERYPHGFRRAEVESLR